MRGSDDGEVSSGEGSSVRLSTLFDFFSTGTNCCTWPRVRQMSTKHSLFQTDLLSLIYLQYRLPSAFFIEVALWDTDLRISLI